MADNVAITAGSGTTVATDDLAGVHYQRIKITWGPDGTANDADVASGKPIPVQLRGSDGSDVSLSDDVAHDAVDSGKPVKIGGKASAGINGKTAVAGDDRTNAAIDTLGRFIMMMNGGAEDGIQGGNSNTDGTSTQFIAASGSGQKNYLSLVDLSNTHATTSVMVALKSGTTTMWRVNVPPGGRRLVWPGRGLAPNAANEAWNFDPDSAVTTIECYGYGYKSPV